MLAPSGPVYQAGTLSGNPLATAAGLATLELIRQTPSFHADLEKAGALFSSRVSQCFEKNRVAVTVNRVGSMMTLFFTDREQVRSFNDAKNCDHDAFQEFFRAAFERGIYLAPSQFEAAFLSSAHTADVIEHAVELFDQAIAANR